MTERKIGEESAVLRLLEFCPNWPNCKATLKSKEIYGGRFPRSNHAIGQEFLGVYCDCAPKEKRP